VPLNSSSWADLSLAGWDAVNRLCVYCSNTPSSLRCLLYTCWTIRGIFVLVIVERCAPPPTPDAMAAFVAGTARTRRGACARRREELWTWRAAAAAWRAGNLRTRLPTKPAGLSFFAAHTLFSCTFPFPAHASRFHRTPCVFPHHVLLRMHRYCARARDDMLSRLLAGISEREPDGRRGRTRFQRAACSRLRL